MRIDDELSRGFSAGNYANAYETEDLERALRKRAVARASEPYRAAFILGFFATYELDEIPSSYRDEFDEAYWSKYGQRVVKLGYTEPRDADYQEEGLGGLGDLTEEEKRDLTAAGWQEGYQAAIYTDVAEWDFREVGVPGETEDDLHKLEYDQAVDVLTSSAWESEQNSRQYAGHPTYEITSIFGDRDRDEWDLEEAYEHYEAGVAKGIERGIAKRLGPESAWRRGGFGQRRRHRR